MSDDALHVLVIEDEASLRLALVDALSAEGFVVSEAADGEAGLARALAEAPDVVLLDLMLPKRDGFSVLRALREDRLDSAVIILSARGEEWDRIQGFEYGADDYVVKPFVMRELLLRIKALLQRTRGGAPGLADEQLMVRFGGVTVDFAGYCLERDGQRTGLSRLELELLRYFLAHAGQVLDRNRILDDVWGRESYPSHRTVDTHVLNLRKKIEPDAEQPRHLLTVRGVGYKFVREG